MAGGRNVELALIERQLYNKKIGARKNGRKLEIAVIRQAVIGRFYCTQYSRALVVWPILGWANCY